ncbi:MAG TPA: hypothetical protein DCS07_04895 [Bdellovibrionales bacterium]|nr:MAG: hypothetical protein A2X97_08795 [Bdellovibrionales bacterium GWA1_52_35]OFZ42313.1 MAG: hypothetical protein A2070_05515 [Bdellovibrionales bacterium GWC1_52_8]HAR41957.1 hypothetical protein [Bdellovibrionales bacterium]HCM38953.1 hypothetical protein [Bdellovibrionales bacterium]
MALVSVAGLAFFFIIPENSPSTVHPLPSPEPSFPNRSLGSAAPPICENFYELICRHQRGVTRDPTGTVKPDLEGELEVLRIYQGIIREHPNWSSQEVDEALVRAVYTPKRLRRVQAVFNWVQQALVKLIQRESAFASANKKLLIQNLKQVRLELPPPAKVYEDEPDLFTKNDVYYERLSSGGVRLRIGGAFLFTSKSWFNLVFTVAHELGHAIDPCEIRDTGGSIPAYLQLESCFVQQHWMAKVKPGSECSANDQLSETFADWIAVQVTAEALKYYATEFSRAQIVGAAVNSVRDLCEQEQSLDESDNRQHPASIARIDKIFGRSPQIRKVLGCEPASKQDLINVDYCEL